MKAFCQHGNSVEKQNKIKQNNSSWAGDQGKEYYGENSPSWGRANEMGRVWKAKIAVGDLASKTLNMHHSTATLFRLIQAFFCFPMLDWLGKNIFYSGTTSRRNCVSSILLLKYWLGTRSKSKHEARHQPLEAGEAAEGLGWETATARWGTGKKTKGGTHTKQPTHTPRGRTKWILQSFAQGKGYSASHPAAEAQLLSPSGQQGGKGKARSTFWLAETNNYS